MPELPEVETVCQGISPTLIKHKIAKVVVRRKDLRFPIPENFIPAIEDKIVQAVSRRAKYILITFSDSTILMIHLGMSGKVLVYPKKRAQHEKHDHVSFYLDNGTELAFNDPRRFGFMDITTTHDLDTHKAITHLGVEPLGNHLHADYLKEQFKNRSIPIKQALMNHEIIVGVGNIYASESLFDAGISPFTPAKKLSKNTLSDLIVSVQKILRDAIASGGSTLKDYTTSNGDAGYFQHSFQVYSRENNPCFKCESAIKKCTQGGRSTFYCSNCQK